MAYGKKNPTDIGKFVLNMIVYLQATKKEHPTHQMDNLEFAIQIFRELRKHYRAFTF
jgi:hypothetical protein